MDQMTKSKKPAAVDGMKKVFVKTYGCQMNVYDSQRMSDALAGDGYQVTEKIGRAHV
jgi:tRNA-2-methylthio-N6-dimethylallyladenosine synthase